MTMFAVTFHAVYSKRAYVAYLGYFSYVGSWSLKSGFTFVLSPAWKAQQDIVLSCDRVMPLSASAAHLLLL
jgi:hypothetical protein